MENDQLISFLQKVNEGSVTEHWDCEPANIYVDGKPATDEDDHLFTYCLEHGYLKISSSYDNQCSNSKAYCLTEKGEVHLQEFTPKPKWVSLGLLLSTSHSPRQ